jgi:site-specific recombinase XerD
VSFDAVFFELPSNDTPPRTFLEPFEIELLIAAATNPRDKAIIACTFLSGCRISEILNLDRTDFSKYIDNEGRQAVMVRGKNGKYRDVLFNETARMYLENYFETRHDSYRELFISGQNRRITVSRVEQIIHECSRRAGLEKRVTPHILRHSFATDLLNNEASLYEVSKSMGHANISTTANIYAHFDTMNMKKVIAKHQSRISIT